MSRMSTEKTCTDSMLILPGDRVIELSPWKCLKKAQARFPFGAARGKSSKVFMRRQNTIDDPEFNEFSQDALFTYSFTSHSLHRSTLPYFVFPTHAAATNQSFPRTFLVLCVHTNESKRRVCISGRDWT